MSDSHGTLGILSTTDNQHICLTLELPDRDNKRGLSRIPDGIYTVQYITQSASGKYTDCYHVMDVPGRSGILFHAGNWAGDSKLGYKTDSLGCILPGETMEFWSGQRAVSNSRKSLTRLHEFTGKQAFELEIINNATFNIN